MRGGYPRVGLNRTVWRPQLRYRSLPQRRAWGGRLMQYRRDESLGDDGPWKLADFERQTLERDDALAQILVATQANEQLHALLCGEFLVDETLHE